MKSATSCLTARTSAAPSVHCDGPRAALAVAAEFLEDDRATGTPKRMKGLQLTATDADWLTGDGPVVEGTLHSLGFAIAGRRVALDGFSGDGLAELRTRVGAA